jgi:ATP-binding cassette subfamily B protein
MAMNRGPRPGMGPRFVLDPNKKINQKKVIMRLWSYMKQNKTGVIIVSASVLIATVINLATPYLISRTYDNYINVDIIDVKAVFFIFVSLVIMGIISSVMGYIQQRLMAIVANKTTQKMRSDAFAKLQLLPISFYDKNAHGEIMSTLTNDI